jgi:tetratricopeptide (TPR) repeat protein
MVKRVIVIAAAAVVIGSLGYFIWLNPAVVDLRFTGEQSLRVPLGWLLVFAFVAGALVAVLGSAVQQLGRSVSGWSQRRRQRVANRVASWERTGLALAWDGDLDQARRWLLKAWRRAPRNQGAALALASSYMDTDEVAKAVEILTEAMTHDASDVDVRYALSEALRRKGEVNEAIRILETVRVQHPRAARALTALRELYRQAGRWHDAAQVQEAYVHSLTNPERASAERERWLHFRYQAAMSLDGPDARVEALHGLLQMDHTYVPAIAALGDALVATDRADEATKLWERALRATPCLVLMQRLLAQQHTERDRQRTLNLLRKLPEVDADTIRFFAARAAFDEGKFDVAATELQAVAKQDHPAVYRLWADIHRQRGMVRDALKAFAQLAEASSVADSPPCPFCQRSGQMKTTAGPPCRHWDGYRAVVGPTS